MPKELKASVKLDAKSALDTLDKLQKKIDAVNKAINKTSGANNQISKNLDKANTSANNVAKNVKKVDDANKKAANSANKIAGGYKKSNSAVSVLTKNLRTLASTYIGVMGAKAVLGASDTITSAENKLNYLNGGDAADTQFTMDKTYAAAQRSRGDYGDMISNVSKSMTLAGDAFQGNVDNAIRFQEIMSKAYTIGGASAAEQSSSMYQLIQALGSGTLQGDELRSVREGAPIAYKEIEKFAQGVYNTTDSLKDMASEGKITSDMVVAAMMQAGTGIDEAFANTDMTFAQAFTSIKNMALQAFRPVLQMLNDALNSDMGRAIIDGLGKAFVVVANIVLWLAGIVGQVFTWFYENWDWLKWVVLAVLAAVTAHLVVLAATAFWAGLQALGAFLAGISPLYVWIIIIVLLIGLFMMFTGEIIGGMLGAWEVIKAVCTWISNAWNNMCANLSSWFWNAIADMLEGVDWLLKGINKIRSALGKETISIEGIRAKADASKAKVVENNLDVGSAWDTGYTKGYAIGTDLKDKISSFVSLDNLTSGLGLNTSSYLPGAYDSAYGVDGAYDPNKALKNIDGNTGKMADSMDLTSEDLEYLRKIADMEWKKEYTTASITVDMSNYNTVSGDGDLDGIVTKLADKLYEEMDYLANGVYA